MAKTGALAVYFADHDDWRIWIGEESVAGFGGGKSLDGARQEFLAEARQRAAGFVETAQKAAGVDKPLMAGQKIKYQVDAVLDGLIFRMETK